MKRTISISLAVLAAVCLFRASQLLNTAHAQNGRGPVIHGVNPESLPDNVFRPLTDWIDYVIEHDRQQLQAWVQSTTFDFESFVCTEDDERRPAGADFEGLPVSRREFRDGKAV